MENTPFSNNLTSILLSKFLQEAGQTFEFKILDPNTEVGRALSLEKVSAEQQVGWRQQTMVVVA